MSADQIEGGATPAANDAIFAAAAELDREAAQLEQGPAAPAVGAGSAQPAPTDWPAEAHDLVDFCAGMFFPLYPRLEAVWNEQRRRTLEGRLAAVLQKYNLNLERLLGKWGPEIMLAGVIAPAIMPTVRAVRDDLADLKAKAKEQARAAPPPDKPAAPAPAPRTMADAAASSAPAGIAPDAAKLHEKA